MAVNSNVYQILQDMVKEELGQSITIYDRATFVSAGIKLTSSYTAQALANAFANNIANKVQLTLNIIRDYSEILRSLDGGVLPPDGGLEVIQHGFYDARQAAFANLTDGVSVDMYVVNKGDVIADYYYNSNAFQIPVTINSPEIAGALSSPEMFTTWYDGKIAMALNSRREKLNLLRLGLMANSIAECFNGTYAETTPATNPDDLSRVYPLVTMYNTINSTNLTADNALYSKDFLRFAVACMNNIKRKFWSRNTAFNPSEATESPWATFTPEESTRTYAVSRFVQNVGAYLWDESFRNEYNRLNVTEEVPYWENASTPMLVTYDNAGNKNTPPVIGVVMDELALKSFSQIDDVDVTPYNAAGKYTNVWVNVQVGLYENRQANFVVFTLG